MLLEVEGREGHGEEARNVGEEEEGYGEEWVEEEGRRKEGEREEEEKQQEEGEEQREVEEWMAECREEAECAARTRCAREAPSEEHELEVAPPGCHHEEEKWSQVQFDACGPEIKNPTNHLVGLEVTLKRCILPSPPLPSRCPTSLQPLAGVQPGPGGQLPTGGGPLCIRGGLLPQDVGFRLLLVSLCRSFRLPRSPEAGEVEGR
jgi:hypothetical protein